MLDPSDKAFRCMTFCKLNLFEGSGIFILMGLNFISYIESTVLNDYLRLS